MVEFAMGFFLGLAAAGGGLKLSDFRPVADAAVSVGGRVVDQVGSGSAGR